MVCVFEGMDAAGKGGAIRRITRRSTRASTASIPIAAPTDEERAQPYLWRFWRHVPRKGCFTIFDRSWYGRVLVERVEGFCSEADWMRAYDEINDFEEQLARNGAVIVQVLAADHARTSSCGASRSARRRASSASRSRPRTGATARSGTRTRSAGCDMIERTSTAHAPWTLVEANDKYHARVKVLDTVVRALEEALDG